MPDKGLIYHEGHEGHEEKIIGLFVIHNNAFKADIPAKAGIQTVINTPTQWGQHPKHGFVRYAELYDKLDSGLRRNDEVAGFAYCRLMETSTDS
jgi:hypothetical protein